MNDVAVTFEIALIEISRNNSIGLFTQFLIHWENSRKSCSALISSTLPKFKALREENDCGRIAVNLSFHFSSSHNCQSRYNTHSLLIFLSRADGKSDDCRKYLHLILWNIKSFLFLDFKIRLNFESKRERKKFSLLAWFVIYIFCECFSLQKKRVDLRSRTGNFIRFCTTDFQFEISCGRRAFGLFNENENSKWFRSGKFCSCWSLERELKVKRGKLLFHLS